MKPLDLGYQKIDMCLNFCMLYYLDEILYKEIFILLLLFELVLQCYSCNYQFKYLQDGQIRNTDTIWRQTLFHTDKNINYLFITNGYTDRLFLLVYSRNDENCPLLSGIVDGTNYTQVYDGLCLSVYSRDEGNRSLHMSVMAIKVFNISNAMQISTR